MNSLFAIEITSRKTGFLEFYTLVQGAPAMEDEVTRLHREYPSHLFECEVRTVR